MHGWQIMPRLRLKIDPDNRRLRQQLIETAKAQGELADVARFLHRLLPRIRSNATLAELAQLEFEIGEFGLVRETVTALRNSHAHGHRAASLLFKASQFDQDRAGMQGALQAAKPAKPRATLLRQRAHMLAAAGLHKDAAEHWRRADRLAAGHYRTLLGLAMCAANTGNAGETAALLGAAIPCARNGDTSYFALVDHLSRQPNSSFAAQRRTMLDAAPGEAGHLLLADARRKLAQIREAPMPEIAGLKATFLCPIHRPSDLRNAIHQITRQSWKNAEAIFAINSPAIRGDEIRRCWNSPMPMRLVDCLGMAPLGKVLNAAMAAASGDIVFKIDADCIYFPVFAADMIRVIHFHKADLATKKSKFRFMAEFGNLDLEMPKKIFQLAGLGEGSNGSALVFRRELWRSVKFQESFKLYEDAAFTLNAVARGFRHIMADPFNHYTIRAKDASSHSWGVDGMFLSVTRPRILMGGPEAIDRIVPA